MHYDYWTVTENNNFQVHSFFLGNSKPSAPSRLRQPVTRIQGQVQARGRLRPARSQCHGGLPAVQWPCKAHMRCRPPGRRQSYLKRCSRLAGALSLLTSGVKSLQCRSQFLSLTFRPSARSESHWNPCRLGPAGGRQWEISGGSSYAKCIMFTVNVISLF